MDKKNKIILVFGSLAFIIMGFFLRSCRPFIFSSDSAFGKFRWGNQVGITLIVIGFIIFVIERWKDLPFFYGQSRTSGTNSISFFVLAASMLFFNITTAQFIIALIVIVGVMVLADWLVMLRKK